MSLSELAVLRSVVHGKLLTPDQLWSALERSEARPLADVLRDHGIDEGKLVTCMTETLADGRVASSSDVTVRAGSAAPGPSLPATPRGTFGKFVLDSKLGEGGMGEVWKATQVDLGRTVALKMVLRGAEGDVARFRREAQLAASLQHPNIVQVYEVGEADGRPYLAMQYVNGQTLAAGRLPLRRALEVIRDAAEAVHHAHLRGIVHRDVKPQNIMTDETGKVFVMDFGLARPAQQPGEGLTVSGELLGTPTYMAPEQTRALTHLIGPPSDVWALGATLYELVTGAKAFQGSNIGDLFEKIQSAEPIAPHKLVPRLDRDIETIILKCLEKDPARRYPTAGELAADLGRTLRGDPILARRPRFWERIVRRVSRNPGIVTAAAFLGLIGVVFAFSGGSRDASFNLQLAAAQRSGDAERAAQLTSNIKGDAAVEATRAAVAAREAAEERAARRDAAQLAALAPTLGAKEHVIAACSMALALDPANRDARARLSALLPKGPFADRLLGPIGGEARLDVAMDEGAVLELKPAASVPFVKPGKYRLTVTRGGAVARMGVTLEAGEWIRLDVRLKELPPGCFLLSNGAGGGIAMSETAEPPASWNDAVAGAKAKGGRLPTKAELERAGLGSEWSGDKKPATDRGTMKWRVVFE